MAKTSTLLKQVRKGLRLDLEEMAKLLGITGQQLRHWEMDHGRPDVTAMRFIRAIRDRLNRHPKARGEIVGDDIKYDLKHSNVDAAMYVLLEGVFAR